MKWNIVTDSSCDLFPKSHPECDAERTSVPFVISVGSKEFVDDENIDIPELLDAMEKEETASFTSCPAPGTWFDQFEKAENSIAITISSQLSGSMNSALAAKKHALEEHPSKNIAVLDSCSTGSELVLCVREIENMIRKGLDFDAIVTNAVEFLKKKKVVFALSSFDNLIKNGRMGKVTGLIAKALGMWGIGIGSDEGKIIFEAKARGAKKALLVILHDMKKRGFSGGKVAISHCDNLALAQTLKEKILETWKDAQIEILPTRGLCSYYAERGGLIVSY